MKNVLVYLLLIFISSSCGIADLRTADIKADRQSFTDHERADDLLANAILKQGMDRVIDFETYKVTGSDHWKGLLGRIGNLWKWRKEKVAFRFSLGDFDGQVEVLEGKKKGFIAGIQSWDYYEIKKGVYRSDVKNNKRISFGLAAYHYYFELANRLVNAPFVRFYGTGEINGKKMDKVLASWGNEKTKDYDQYVVWIGRESGLIEAVTHTVRDNYLPMSGFLYSTARFGNFRNIDGVMIPFLQTVQLKNPKDNQSKYIHQLTVESFEWDAFPVSRIKPNASLKPVGDDKAMLSLQEVLWIDGVLDAATLMNE